MHEGYRTGRGRVIMRARTHFEDMEKGNRQAIIVDELPYQVNKKSLLERIAELVNEKKLEGISEIRDESDKSGMRMVIELKRGEVPEVVLNNLYKQTQLQDSFGINMVALVDGQPRLLNLKQMLDAFLAHRREVVTRRTVFELRKARERGHMLEGLAVALSNVDEIIALIKAVADAARSQAGADGAGLAFAAGGGDARARARPMLRVPTAWRQISACVDGGYHLSDAQAQAILEMRLQRLTGLEQDKIVVRIQGSDGADRRSARHPGQARAHHRDHRRRTERDQGAVSATERRARSSSIPQDLDDGGPDHAGRHGGDAVAHRLHQVAAARRIQRAEARRARQAGDRDQGRRFHRAAVHRQHARLHAVLLQPRPRVLAQGLRGAAGLAQQRAASRSSICSRWRRARRSPPSCR